MHAFFVGECSNDSVAHERFWELSWYEWSLYARRHKIKVDQLITLDECEWARFRIMWALYINTHKSENDPVVEPHELIKLSFDKPVEAPKSQSKEEIEASFKKAKELLGGKFKRGE
jgi:hypothetical protein